MMTAVGIDPSLTCTGLGFLNADGEPIVRTFPTSTEGGDLTDYDRRVSYITGQLLKVTPARCLTVIEAPFVPHHGGAGQVIERAWLFGFIVSQFLRRRRRGRSTRPATGTLRSRRCSPRCVRPSRI